jgi:hypothetical protein
MGRKIRTRSDCGGRRLESHDLLYRARTGLEGGVSGICCFDGVCLCRQRRRTKRRRTPCRATRSNRGCAIEERDSFSVWYTSVG